MSDNIVPLKMLTDVGTSEEIQLEGKSAIDSVCLRESSPTGQTLKFPEQLVVKTLLDTVAYRSLIRPTVLNRIQKDAILEKDDEIHTLCCTNKMMNETMGSVKLKFTISDEIYEHWFLIFKEQSCPVILGLDFLKENRMYAICSMQLSEEQHKGVNKLLEKFDMLFSAGTQGFKQAHLTEYIIENVGIP